MRRVNGGLKMRGGIDLADAKRKTVIEQALVPPDLIELGAIIGF